MKYTTGFCYGRILSKRELKEWCARLEWRKHLLEEEVSCCIYEDWDNDHEGDISVTLPIGTEVYLAYWGDRIDCFLYGDKYYDVTET